jgi:hypothetical protein
MTSNPPAHLPPSKRLIGQDLGEKGLGETSVLKEIGDLLRS